MKKKLLMLTLFLIIIPTVKADSLNLYVNSFDGTKQEWSIFGNLPWLNATGDNNYIYDSVDQHLIYDFEFEDTLQTGTINIIYISFYCNSSNPNEDITFFLRTDSVWTEFPLSSGCTNTWNWHRKDVSSYLDTWTKINDVKLAIRLDVGGGGGGGGGACLVNSTLVQTLKGFKTIEDVNVGDTLIGWNDGIVPANVTEKKVHSGSWKIYILKGEGYDIKLTGIHLLYTDHGLKPVRDITIDDRLLMFKNGKLIPTEIGSISVINWEGKVYDIKTTSKNFFSQGILIHNSKTPLTTYIDAARIEIDYTPSDTTPPTYSNAGSDPTTIGPGDIVKIYANWSDGAALDKAWLSTNETGEWKNYTDKYRVNFNGVSSGWGNFTWMNDSISSGVIAWRIYSNDTSGNENATVMGTFEVVPIYNFETWAEGPGFFTTGEPEIVNIYVKNTGNVEDSYNITYNKEVTDPWGADNLVQISLTSNRINSVKKGRLGNTFATVTLLGPVNSAKIWFNVTSIYNGTIKETKRVTIGSAYPISLPEFQLVGLLLLLLFSTLIISYSFHFRH